MIWTSKFQSTLLMRGATLRDQHLVSDLHFNPRSSCEERHPALWSEQHWRHYFNPRSSCEERPQLSCSTRRTGYFNPRSSCEERLPDLTSPRVRPYFNPRSSCEERRPRRLLLRAQRIISIHAPHARSDVYDWCSRAGLEVFQSTLLMRGATILHDKFRWNSKISIHAPHARSDDSAAL